MRRRRPPVSDATRLKISRALKGRDPVNRKTLYTEELNRSRSDKQKGRIHTPHARRLNSLAKIGNKYGLGHHYTPTAEARKKMSLARIGKFKGPAHPNWKGTTSANQLFRTSMAYKAWRQSIFQRDDYRCLDCGEKGVTLNADHIYPFAYFERLRLDINNGRTLCRSCHKKTDTYGRKAKQKYEWQTKFTT